MASQNVTHMNLGMRVLCVRLMASSSSGTVHQDPADTGKEQEPAEGTGSDGLDLRTPVAQDQEDKHATYSHWYDAEEIADQDQHDSERD